MENNIKVDLNKCDDALCECGNGLFIQGFTLKRVPGIMMAKTKDTYVNVNQMVCASCLKIFIPEDQRGSAMKVLGKDVN